MKVYTQEEALDLTLGKKGTPLRDKYEAKVKRYLTGLLKCKMLQLPEGTPDSDPDMKELTMLGNLVADYEEEHFPIDN